MRPHLPPESSVCPEEAGEGGAGFPGSPSKCRPPTAGPRPLWGSGQMSSPPPASGDLWRPLTCGCTAPTSAVRGGGLCPSVSVFMAFSCQHTSYWIEDPPSSVTHLLFFEDPISKLRSPLRFCVDTRGHCSTLHSHCWQTGFYLWGGTAGGHSPLPLPLKVASQGSRQSPGSSRSCWQVPGHAQESLPPSGFPRERKQAGLGGSSAEHLPHARLQGAAGDGKSRPGTNGAGPGRSQQGQGQSSSKWPKGVVEDWGGARRPARRGQGQGAAKPQAVGRCARPEPLHSGMCEAVERPGGLDLRRPSRKQNRRQPEQSLRGS